ncbi:hypothetical protein [Streptomyces sp. CBMA29]|uniref:hypothetical protein n=1 Tax=Streptomyces sp. CBMA29 TaxID=1896314 RepID=UPI001661B73E|nr:hypothetical protein [Streptomyces sp. CBMA29]MBD0740323.1 hypothetical protein [Streptomyces sp. CBMA29]
MKGQVLIAQLRLLEHVLPAVLSPQSDRDRRLTELVSQYVVWPQGSQAAIPPVLLLLGPAKSGKTELLKQLGSSLSAVPHAYADLNDTGPTADPLAEVLSSLVEQLYQHQTEQPPLKLDAFRIALLATAAEVKDTQRQPALERIRSAVAGPDRGSGSREQLLQEALNIIGEWTLASPGSALVNLLPQLLRTLQHSRREHMANGLLRRIPAPNFRNIAEGIHSLYQGSANDRREAEKILVDTLLSDLRHAYVTARDGRRRTAGCVLLLDNADSELGRRLLPMLVDSRARMVGAPTGVADPLLIAAAAGRPPLALHDSQTMRTVSGDPDARRPAASPQDWNNLRARLGNVRQAPYYPIMLRGLTSDETMQQAGRFLDDNQPQSLPDDPLPGQWLGWIVHRLTGGHPGATRRIFDELALFGPETDWPVRLNQLFSPAQRQPIPNHSIVDELLGQMLPNGAVPPQIVAFLPQLSAATTLDEAEATEELWLDPQGIRGAYEDALAAVPRENWYAADGSASVLQPLARYALLRRLAQGRDRSDRDQWEQTHIRLLDHAVRAGDRRLEHRHKMALHHFTDVVRYLRQVFDEHDANTWHQIYRVICTAPNRLWYEHPVPPGGQSDPSHIHFQRLVNAANPDPDRQIDSAIARALIGGWLATDPLCDPRAEMHANVRHAFAEFRVRTTRESDRHVWQDLLARYPDRPWA